MNGQTIRVVALKPLSRGTPVVMGQNARHLRWYERWAEQIKAFFRP